MGHACLNNLPWSQIHLTENVKDVSLVFIVYKIGGKKLQLLRGGFLKMIPISIPTYASMKIRF